MDFVLRTIDLTKRFGKRIAVDHLDLEVERGSVFGFLGPNGAGKSTTIRMMLSLIKPDHGDVEIFGKSIRKHHNLALKRVGALVESADFYLYLSGEENLKILARLNGGVDQKRIDEVLAIVRLLDRKKDKVKKYSHGMKQRLGIAQALISRPDLIILDEPTAGLDPEGMKEVRELILKLSREQSITIFLSSHLLHEVEQTCTHMAIINRGKLIAQGKVDELLMKSGLLVTELHVDKPVEAENFLRGISWVKEIETDDEILKVKIPAEKRPELIREVVNRGINISAAIPRSSLEDYFLTLTRNEPGA